MVSIGPPIVLSLSALALIIVFACFFVKNVAFIRIFSRRPKAIDLTVQEIEAIRESVKKRFASGTVPPKKDEGIERFVNGVWWTDAWVKFAIVFLMLPALGMQIALHVGGTALNDAPISLHESSTDSVLTTISFWSLLATTVLLAIYNVNESTQTIHAAVRNEHFFYYCFT